jgi:hypothetical protein
MSYNNLIFDKDLQIRDLQEQIEIGNFIYNQMISFYEAMDETGDNYFTEGANLDGRELVKEFNKTNKYYLREYIRAVKEKDYNKAKKALSKSMSLLNKTEKDIKNLDYTVGSAILGFFANALITGINIIFPGIFTAGLGSKIYDVASNKIWDNLIARAGGEKITKNIFDIIMRELGETMYVASYITTIVAVVVIFIKDVVQLCKDLNSAKDAKDVVNSFNMYRKYLLTTMNNYRKVIEALDKGLDKKMAK